MIAAIWRGDGVVAGVNSIRDNAASTLDIVRRTRGVVDRLVDKVDDATWASAYMIPGLDAAPRDAAPTDSRDETQAIADVLRLLSRTPPDDEVGRFASCAPQH